MNQTYVTLSGVVASGVDRKQLTDGTPLTTFRLAARTRKWDFKTKAYVDGETTWVSVACWRGLAVNVGQSVVKRDRVVVHGRVRTPEWVDDKGGRHTYIEVVADAVGHDLTFGTSIFTRVSRVQGSQDPAQAEADEAVRAAVLGPPSDLSSLLDGDRAIGSAGPAERDPEEDFEFDEDDEDGALEEGGVTGALVAAGR